MEDDGEQLEERLEMGCEWRRHSKKPLPLLHRFPDSLRVVEDEAEGHWAVLAEPLLLPALNAAVRALRSQGLNTLTEVNKYVASRSSLNLEVLARFTGRQNARQLLRDAGLIISDSGAGVITLQSTPTPQSTKGKIAASLSPASIKQEPSALVKAPASNGQQAAVQPQASSIDGSVEVVDNVQRCLEVVKLLTNDQPLALDCEGHLWGKIDVCLVQIASKSGQCFLFDLRQGGPALFTDGGLRRLLEDVNVLKVGHDLRSDASALYLQFNVFLNHIFDTQVGHAFLEPAQSQTGLNTVLDKYASGAQNELKQFMKLAWEEDRDYWRRRPLTAEMRDYAANDAFDAMAHKLRQKSKYEQALSFSRVRADNARSLSSPESKPLLQAFAAVPEESSVVIDTNCHVQEEEEDLGVILNALPEQLRKALSEDERLWGLTEIVLDLGRPVMARYSGQGLPRMSQIGSDEVTADDLETFCNSITHFDSENRAGVSRTLHRISRLQNRYGDVVGLTIRVGKTIRGLVTMIADVLKDAAARKTSILLLGAPGVGKTSVIREMARALSDHELSVMIVDTSNEIAGDGDVPHPAIGSARHMQVTEASQQHRRMIEAVQNHTPDVIIVDEIGTRDEAAACCTIARRGVMLIATAHGVTLKDVVDNPSLNAVVGGIESVILSDKAMNERQLPQKTVREAKGPSAFGTAIELKSRNEWIIHHDVRNSVNLMLADRHVPVEVRKRDDDGRVVATLKHMKATSGLEENQQQNVSLAV